MKRRVNFRFLACLLVALALLGGGGYFLHAYQLRHNAHELLEKANQETAAGHLPEAIKSYRFYLQIVPNDGDALAEYGLTLDRSSKSRRDRETVFFVLDKALRFNPDRDDARRRLVDVAMNIGRYTDALEVIQPLMKRSPDNAELECLLGRCLEGTGNYDGKDGGAAEQYRLAIKHKPAQVESYVRLADLLRLRLNKGAESERLMNEMVKANSSAEAYVARARYYRKGGTGINREDETLTRTLLGTELVACFAGNGAGPNCLTAALVVRSGGGPDLLFKAEQDLKKARATQPDDLEVLLLSSDVARARNWFDQAERYARRGLELYPKDVRLYGQVAELTALRGRRGDAVKVLEQGVKELPDEIALPFQLAEFLLAEGLHEKAAEPIAKLQTMHVDPALLTFLDGRRKFVQGNWLEASRSLELAYPALVNLPEKARQTALLLGKCYQQLGEPDKQYGAYRRALSEDPYDPFWFEASEGVANALLALNKVDEAVEIYRRLIPRAPAARIVVARLLLQRNLNLPEARREWGEVEQLLAEAETQFPESTEVSNLRAQVLAAGNKNKEASKLLEKVQVDAPTDVSVWVTRAALARAGAEGKPADALKMLDLATKTVGDRVDLRLARLRYLLRTEDQSIVKESLAKLEEGAEKFSPSEQRRLWRGLAQAYMALGVLDKAALDKARQLWERVAAEKPNDLTIQAHLFDLALLSNDDSRLEVVLREIRRLEGENGTVWRYGKAVWLVNRGQKGDKAALEEARPLLAAVAAQRPTWSRVPACQGKREVLAGNPNAAIDYYWNAIELGERNSDVLLAEIGLLNDRQSHGDAEKALQVIGKLPEQAPLVNQLSDVVVVLSLQTKDNATALKVAKKAVADNPKDYRKHLFLGQAYWALGHLKEAENALRAALAVADTNPQTLTILVVFLARPDSDPEHGRIKDAETEITKAKSKLPVDKNRLAYAYCYEVVGDLKEAEQLLNAALKEAPNDVTVLQTAAGFFLRTGKNEEAKRCFKSLTQQNQQFPEEAAKARQLLAFVLVSEAGDYEQKRQHLAELGFLNPSAEKVASESPDDKRVRAVLQAAQGRRSDREEAARTLEEISKLQPLATSDLFNLAILYQSLGDKGKVNSLMQTLLSKEADNPRYVAFYAQFLLAQEDLDQAQLWVSRLEKQQPEAGRTYELTARLLHAQGKNGAAVDLLTKYAEKKDAPLLPIAVLLEQIGHTTGDNRPAERMYEPAERMYEKVVEKAKKPEASLILAGFYSRTGRMPEALDLCDRLRATCPPDTVMIAALLILYENHAGEADLKRVEGWLREALAAAEKDPKQKDPKHRANLRQQLATMYALQNRTEEAEKTYRRCLEDNPRDLVALNNFAWLLALKGNKTDEALASIQKAIDVAGPLASLRDTRATVYLAQGKTGLALAELTEIVEDNPKPTNFFHLALVQYAVNEKAAARDNLRQAQERGLKEKDLHPFERDRYQKLLADLEMR